MPLKNTQMKISVLKKLKVIDYMKLRGSLRKFNTNLPKGESNYFIKIDLCLKLPIQISGEIDSLNQSKSSLRLFLDL